MTGIAGIVAPVFALIALGAAARFWRVLDLAGLKGLTDLTFYLLIPALLFSSVIEAETLRVLDVAALFFGACVVVFVAGVVLARRFLGLGLGPAAVVGLNCCYGNTVMLGVPVVSAAFGAEGVAILLPIIALHSMLLLPMATVLIEADGTRSMNPARIVLATLPSLVRNPVIMALVAALVWRGVGVPEPGALHRLLMLLAGAAPAVALFSLGASLPDFAAQGSVRETGLAVVLKLVVQPLLVWGLGLAVGLAPLPMAVAVLVAGTPTGANAFFLARRTNIAAASSAGTVVVATALSVVTLSIWLGLVRG